MTSDPIVSHLVALLVGILIGAAGQYFADKYTDQRRRQETARQNRQQFKKVQEQMPELIEAMKVSLQDPQLPFVREFVITRRGWIINSPEKKFRYYFEDHPNLQAKVKILENNGYVEKSESSDILFQMKEEFVQLILNS